MKKALQHLKKDPVMRTIIQRVAPYTMELEDDAVIEHLTRVKGIGVWTAHMFLMFALQRPNVLPIGDLGVRAAIRKQYGLEALPTVKEIEELAKPWHPYCSIATWYLWRSLGG